MNLMIFQCIYIHMSNLYAHNMSKWTTATFSSIKTASCTALLVVDVDKPKDVALRDGI